MSSNLENVGIAQVDKPEEPNNIEDAIKRAETFLCTEAPSLGRIFGIDLDIQPGKAWSTDLESGKVTVDLRFFIDKGYTPDMAVYGVLHEVAAHLQDVVRHPEYNKEVVRFSKQGKAYSLFHSVFSDITGNNQIHSILPRMKEVATQTYAEKVFPEDDFTTTHPRHIQFLYAILRDEMIPDSEAKVRPEVSEAIANLRDYQGKGDLIKFSTSPVKEGTKQTFSPQERFNIWLVYIFPVYEDLLRQDKEDPLELEKPEKSENLNSDNEQSYDESTENNDSQNSRNNGEEQPAQEKSSNSFDKEDSDGSVANEKKEKRPVNPNYDDFYEEYKKTRHPQPDELEHIHDQKPKEKTPEQKIADEFEKKTGFSIRDKQNYNNMIRKNQQAINAMREAFIKIINDRVTKVKKLKGRHKDGALLNPDSLAQTFIDIQSHISEPPAFLDYEKVSGEREIVGKTDYYFVMDTSGSMHGERAKHAANALVVALEGLCAMERDIVMLEKQGGVETDLDIKTALYSFGTNAVCIKPLSGSLDDKTRLTAIQTTLDASDGGTNDFLALEEIEKQIPEKSERQQIIFVITDGASANPMRTKDIVKKLRSKGVIVIGVAIGSQEAVSLYSPTSELVVDPNDLPKLLEKLIIKGL